MDYLRSHHRLKFLIIFIEPCQKFLELPADQIRIIQPALGGAFGGKSDPFGHELVAAKLAIKTGQPVKILLNREETFFHPPWPTSNAYEDGVSGHERWPLNSFG